VGLKNQHRKVLKYRFSSFAFKIYLYRCLRSAGRRT